MRKIIIVLLTFAPLGAAESMPSIKEVVSSQDVKLLNEISSRLKGRFELYNINVYVENGVVILAGTVHSYDEKNVIEQEVKKTGGVTKVSNKIQVKR